MARLIAVMLCVIATAAVAITAPAVVAARRSGAPLPDAPGLAALSGHQLADLLPTQNDFPAGWTRKETFDAPEGFGYGGYHNIGAVDGYQPVECYEVAYGIRTGSYPAATVAEHDPADPSYLMSDSTDIRMEVGREFNPAVFDEMRSRVSRCLHFRVRFPGFLYTVRILEDSRPVGAPQRFRYSVTVTDEDNSAHTIATHYYSYARVSGLIVSGMGTTGHEHMLDRFFEDILHRTHAADHPR
jgi:hypothetical protein